MPEAGNGMTPIVDQGAYERVIGDLVVDSEINAADLAILLGSWGPCDIEICPADINGDGGVNAADLALLLGNWGG